MGDVVRFPRRHGWTSAGSRRKKASIDTSPPDTSLSRLASPRDASLRPAIRLRRCDSEQPAATATSGTVRSARLIHEAIGCDMEASISGRNAKVKTEIFPAEMRRHNVELLKCGMAKKNQPPKRIIHLKAWMELEPIGPTELAEIAGCTQSYISNLAANRKPNPNVLFLLAISEYFGITVNDLYEPPPSAAQIIDLQGYSERAREKIMRLVKRKR